MGHQIIAEGDSSPADVFLTENSPAMTLVERAGLLAAVDPATRQQVPKDAAPSSNAWISIAARSTVLVYNTARLTKADLPTSLMDLKNPSGRTAGAAQRAVPTSSRSWPGCSPTRANRRPPTGSPG